jgi:hypothetical protein
MSNAGAFGYALIFMSNAGAFGYALIFIHALAAE